MIGSITSNGLLSAAFGPGALRELGGSSTQRAAQLITPSGRLGGQDHAQPVDEVELSDAARRLAEIAAMVTGTTGLSATGRTGEVRKGADARASNEPPSGLSGTGDLAPEDEAQVRKLREQDAEVRRHEQAHKASAGQFASGGPTFTFETGPDGRRYAVSGEVQIDTSEVKGDPQATIRKMQQVRRAALAPGNPSSQDRAVAAQASQTERQARAEVSEQSRDSQASATGGSTAPTLRTDPQNASEAPPTADQTQASHGLLDLIA